MTVNFKIQVSRNSLIPQIGHRQRFKLNGVIRLLTLNRISIERNYNYFPEPGQDHAFYDVELVYGAYHNR